MKWFFVALAAAAAVYLGGDADLSLRFYADVIGVPEKAFAEKSVWIIGASTGIGAALAHDLASKGATIVLSARRKADLDAVSAECVRRGAKAAHVVVLDVLDFQAHSTAAARVSGLLGGMADVVVLNAGRSQRLLALETPLEDTRALLELNLLAPISLAKVVAPTMRRGSRLVVTSSLSGVIGTPAASSYSATKFALHGFFNALRVELFRQGVGVTLICPGPVQSDIALHVVGKRDGASDLAASKMPTSRCASLMTAAIHFSLGQIWLSKQPELLFTALAQYAPRVFENVINVAGQNRLDALKAGTDIFSSSNYVFGGAAKK
ncbi:hypothetical protein M885DRAFT_457125 [Pelagophyceae sp. CCMP2097]|nr:hypothetical protein M885DRAFT_457125 [Pelagophyceae sp. CCMP2097]|mmetsp:Transcript_2778/g.10203  ORF Transcript_2778/g.10203 Transcript_2778/m.10203 type:complete len:322 (+) Transcript_2778:88-1053(+)